MFLFFIACSTISVDQRQINIIERLIAFHRFWDAYNQLNTIISQEGSKVDNKLYRLRAQCALNMGMTQECCNDVELILSNKPTDDDRKFAYMLEARSHIQKGEFQEAKSSASKSGDFRLQRSINDLINTEASANSKLEQGQIGEASQLLDRLIQNAPKANDFLHKRADIAWMSRDFDRYKQLSEQLEKEYPNDAKLFYRRGIILFCDGQMEQASKRVKYSKVLKYSLSNCSEALEAINEINVHYPRAQKAVEQKNANDAEIEIQKSLDAGEKYCPSNSVLLSTINNLKVKLIRIQKTPEEAIKELTKMIEKNPYNVELMLERGEVNLEIEDYDAALFDFQNAQRHRPNDRRAHEGINKANEIKKRKTYVDHYQTLGLQKGASSVEIKTSYKKLVRQWHPDRFGDPDKKKEAESMMKKINQAYDILGDEQKKRLYDMGRDPDDPMAGRQPFDGFQMFNMGGGRTFTFRNGGGFHFEFHM